MNDEPQKHEVDEVKLRKFHSRLIATGKVTEMNIGSEDQLVERVGGDPDKLSTFRSRLIGADKFTEVELGGSEVDFRGNFLKKNDAQLSSSKSSPTTQEKYLPAEKTEELDNADLDFQDYLNVTDSSGNAIAKIASDFKNSELAEAQEERERKVADQKLIDKTHEISNTIAKAVGWIKPSQAYTGKEGLLDRESDLKMHMDDLEEAIQKEHNPENKKELRVISRQQLALAFKDQFVADFDAHMKLDKIDLYEALVRSPNSWRCSR
jgi:hypothetical protein